MSKFSFVFTVNLVFTGGIWIKMFIDEPKITGMIFPFVLIAAIALGLITKFVSE